MSPILLAAPSKARVCGRSLARIWVRICREHWCLPLVVVVCCQVRLSATGRSLDQRGPTECGVSEYDSKASTKLMPWLSSHEKKDNKNVRSEFYIKEISYRCQNMKTAVVWMFWGRHPTHQHCKLKLLYPCTAHCRQNNWRCFKRCSTKNAPINIFVLLKMQYISPE
jgi:hypothetical protein